MGHSQSSGASPLSESLSAKKDYTIFDIMRCFSDEFKTRYDALSVEMRRDLFASLCTLLDPNADEVEKTLAFHDFESIYLAK